MMNAQHPECVTPEGQVLGLVLTLCACAHKRAQAMEALSRIEGLELGEPQGPWVAACVQTPEPMELHRRLEAIEGIELVDVAFVELGETA